MSSALDKLNKLNSRLRCVANGKTDVNSIRAEMNGAVRVTTAKEAPSVAPIVSGLGLKTRAKTSRRPRPAGARRRSQAMSRSMCSFCSIGTMQRRRP